MVAKIINTFAGLSMYLAFWLTFLSLLGFFYMGIFQGKDISQVVPIILGLYITNRTAVKWSAHKAAASDPAVDTAQVISSTDDK